MKVVGYLFLLISMQAWALVPLEGIVMGEAEAELQNDPLASIFTQRFDEGVPAETQKIKKFQRLYQQGTNLNQTCPNLQEPRYFSSVQSQTARRSMVATLQHIALDSTIKSIGTYARRLEIKEEDYQRLTDNLVNNFCSKNVTVISLRHIGQSLKHYYQNPLDDYIPTVANSPYVSENLKASSDLVASRSRELDTAIKVFRSFCSWGGDTEDYRMLAPFLKDPFLQAMVIDKMTTEEKGNSFKVLCQDLICREASDLEFTRHFPRSMGSTGLETDLQKQYCFHFRGIDYEPRRTIENVAAWIKKDEIESPLFEKGFLVSLITGVPNFMFSAQKYSDLPMLLKGPVDERWNRWAKSSISNYSQDLYYEESLRVRAEPRRDLAAIKYEGLKINFEVSLGEIDRLMKDQDKIKLSFDLKLPKNYLRSMRNEWLALSNRLATEEKQEFMQKNTKYIAAYLEPKEQLFQQKMWNDQFARLVSQELLEQVLRYETKAFDSYQEEMMNIPVTFSYGVFALNYLRYRADVQKGRLKVNL